jgi:serine/threonine-protein kinase
MTLAQLGRYKIIGPLGQGAMGTVYRAHDPLIERTVAIKTVSCSGLSRSEAEAFEQRFFREAKSAGRLNHPNIVTIHDIGRSDDLAYIAMEFLDGRSLRDILDSGVVLPLERIAEIAAEIADGLAFAHANDVVHRDIKPANIMVLDNDTVKIADFGIALLPSGSHTIAGTAFGSPKYMSPEQVTGQKADGRSDIFSLGAVLYEMLTGRPPFTGDDLHAILYQVLNGAPPLPTTYNPSLPRGFDRIVARAMAKDPDKRYQNATEMATHLRKYRHIVRQARKKQHADNALPTAPRPAATATDSGAATVQLKAITAPPSTAPNKHLRPLLYGTLLLALALFTGWLLRPVPPQAQAQPVPVAPPAAKADSSIKETEPSRTEPEVVPQAAKAPPVAVEGRIRLAIAPWGEIHIDGKKTGNSPPLTEIRLPAGKHRIEIRNATFAPYRQNVDLAPDATIRIKHKFE